MKLNKFIAQNTHYSRSQADKIIKEGRVLVKGKRTMDLKTEVNPDKDKIRLDKKLIANKSVKTYMILNKPKGYLSSTTKEEKKKTILKFIPPRKHLKPVGRLDLESEGLILLSNDGEFINRYNNPSNKKHFEKEYMATVSGKIAEPESAKLKKNIKSLNILKSNTRETLLTLVINEGRNRQIRKMFDSIHHPVKYLQRIRVGNIKLGSLKRGKCRPLTKEEIDAE